MAFHTLEQVCTEVDSEGQKNWLTLPPPGDRTQGLRIRILLLWSLVCDVVFLFCVVDLLFEWVTVCERTVVSVDFISMSLGICLKWSCRLSTLNWFESIGISAHSKLIVMPPCSIVGWGVYWNQVCLFFCLSFFCFNFNFMMMMIIISITIIIKTNSFD